MTPRHRIPPSQLTYLHEVPCRDCGHVVRVRLATETSGKPFPVFCNACLTARIKDIQAERRPRRRVTHPLRGANKRKTA